MTILEANSLLKACPFCGGKAKVEKYATNTVYVYCTQCGIRTRDLKPDTDYCANEELVKKWNTRYTEQTMEGRAFKVNTYNSEEFKIITTEDPTSTGYPGPDIVNRNSTSDDNQMFEVIGDIHHPTKIIEVKEDDLLIPPLDINELGQYIDIQQKK